ncbi:bacterioferritin-associated ferredoxin [Rhodococcus sp. NPDC058505]|uniref:(2Fe-2S)-binding protein n=1 Tax=unclassified Rhodococcus (in: high G+C Gram-positive bacteria) TaxID=192944 RepID=UPI0036669402
MYVCVCEATTEETVHQCISAGARTAKHVALGCGAGRGRGCGMCRDRIKSMIEQHYATVECEDEPISA